MNLNVFGPIGTSHRLQFGKSNQLNSKVALGILRSVVVVLHLACEPFVKALPFTRHFIYSYSEVSLFFFLWFAVLFSMLCFAVVVVRFWMLELGRSSEFGRLAFLLTVNLANLNRFGLVVRLLDMDGIKPLWNCHIDQVTTLRWAAFMATRASN